MRVISKRRLIMFWEKASHQDSKGPLQAWYSIVSSKDVSWRKWADVRAVYSNADLVGNCVVFNIGGNKYRLITRIFYPSHKVFILKVMTHKEYDQADWKAHCGCFSPPPPKPKQEKATVKQPKGKSKRKK